MSLACQSSIDAKETGGFVEERTMPNEPHGNNVESEELEEGELDDDEENVDEGGTGNDEMTVSNKSITEPVKEYVKTSSKNDAASVVGDNLSVDRFVGPATDEVEDFSGDAPAKVPKYRSHRHRRGPKIKHDLGSDYDKGVGAKRSKTRLPYANDYDDVTEDFVSEEIADGAGYHKSPKWLATSHNPWSAKRSTVKLPRGPYDSPESSENEIESSQYGRGPFDRQPTIVSPTSGDETAADVAANRSDETEWHRGKYRHQSSLATGIPRLMDVLVDPDTAGDGDKDMEDEPASIRSSRSRLRPLIQKSSHPRKRKLVDTPMDERPHCKFFMDGKCVKGGDCPFNHDFEPPKKAYLCKYYLTGTCTRGKACVYYHNDWPCRNFHLHGSCSYGDSCKFSHEVLTDETRPLLEMALEEEHIQSSPAKKQYCNTDLHLSCGPDGKKKIPSLLDIPVYSPGKAPKTLPPGTITPPRNQGFGEMEDINDVDEDYNQYSSRSDEIRRPFGGYSRSYDNDDDYYYDNEECNEEQYEQQQLDDSNLLAGCADQDQEEQEHDLRVNRDETSTSGTVGESWTEADGANCPVTDAPTNSADLSRLPPMQRELYLRIQKHQRLHDKTDADEPSATSEPVAADNDKWYSSDEDDERKGTAAGPVEQQPSLSSPVNTQPPAMMPSRPSIFNVPPPLLPHSMQPPPGGMPFMPPPFNLPPRNQLPPMHTQGMPPQGPPAQGPQGLPMQGMPPGLGSGPGLLPTPGQGMPRGMPPQGFARGLPPQGFQPCGFSGPGMPQGMPMPPQVLPSQGNPQGISQQGLPNPGMPPSAVPSQGIPPVIQGPGMSHGYPSQGLAGQGMPPGMPGQRLPSHGIPPLLPPQGPGNPGHGIPPLLPPSSSQGITHGMPLQGMPPPGMPVQGMSVPGMQAPISASPSIPVKFDIGQILSVIRSNMTSSTNTTTNEISQLNLGNSRDPRASDPRLRPSTGMTSSKSTEIPITSTSPPASPPAVTASSPPQTVEVNSVGRRVAYILRLITVMNRPSIPMHVTVAELKERNDPRLLRYSSTKVSALSPSLGGEVSEVTRKIRTSPPAYSLPDIVLPPVGSLPPKVDETVASVTAAEFTVSAEWKLLQSVDRTVRDSGVKIPEALQERNYPPILRPDVQLQRYTSIASTSAETSSDKKTIDYRNDPRYKKKKTRSLSKDDELGFMEPSKTDTGSRNGRAEDCDIENFRSSNFLTQQDDDNAFVSPNIGVFNAMMRSVDLPGSNRSSSDSDGHVTPPVMYSSSQMPSFSLTVQNSDPGGDDSPQVEVSLKDMFKTIDPTTSPFC